MSFKNYWKTHWLDFILKIIFWTTFLTINNYFIWWKGYFKCLEDNLNNKVQVEIIDNSDETKVLRKTTGWLHLNNTIKIEQDKK